MITHEEIDSIKGWYDQQIVELVRHMNRWQIQNGVHGHIVEIGVYCGRSFVGLAECCRQGEKAYAIDVFNRQEWNESRSGSGHVEDMDAEFDATTARFGVSGQTVKIAARSTDLTPSTLRERIDGLVRMFRIDGGHSYAEAMNDISLAVDILSPHGVIFIDDMFNSNWPDVSTAAAVALRNGILAPLAIYKGECMFCRRDEYESMKSCWKGLKKDLIRKWLYWDVSLLL